MKSDNTAPDDSIASIETVMQAWFSDEQTGRLDLPQPKRWFMGGKALDDELRIKFSSTLAQARSGRLDHWQNTAQGSIALIVLLDQINRNIYRGTAEAFACDAQARGVCQHALESQYDQELSITQRIFCYLPLEHDETSQSQISSVALFEKLYADAPEQLKDFARRTLDSALEHKAIIDQFGRYPYRNSVLDRTSTPDEVQWMAESNKRFGQ